MMAAVESWVQILIQVPILAAFIWYSIETGKQNREAQDKFLAALDKRDEAYERRSVAITQAINAGNASVLAAIAEMRREGQDHDDLVREKLAVALGQRKKTLD